MKTFISWLMAALCLSLCPVFAVADLMADQPPKAHTPAQIINDAVKAGPRAITDHAAIMSMDGKKVRDGTNGWTCYSGPNVNGTSSMCIDAVWQKWIEAYMGKAAFQTDKVGIAYMLAGDEGTANNDPWATGPTPTNQWVAEGPHIMVIVPNAAALQGISTDPNNGGPYVMWAGTPYAHIMIPVGPRKPMHAGKARMMEKKDAMMGK